MAPTLGLVARSHLNYATCLCGYIQESQVTGSELSQEEKDLIELSRRCEQGAENLKHELQKMRTVPSPNVLQAVRKTARTLLKKDKIVQIQEQMERYKSTLEISLLSRLR